MSGTTQEAFSRWCVVFSSYLSQQLVSCSGQRTLCEGLSLFNLFFSFSASFSNMLTCRSRASLSSTRQCLNLEKKKYSCTMTSDSSSCFLLSSVSYAVSGPINRSPRPRPKNLLWNSFAIGVNTHTLPWCSKLWVRALALDRTRSCTANWAN